MLDPLKGYPSLVSVILAYILPLSVKILTILQWRDRIAVICRVANGDCVNGIEKSIERMHKIHQACFDVNSPSPSEVEHSLSPVKTDSGYSTVRMVLVSNV